MVGEKLKKAIERSGKERTEVASAMGISEGNLYKLFKKDSFELDYLRRASRALNIPLAYFIEEDSQILELPQVKSADAGAFGERVLERVADGIEELKKFFEEEIRTKNQQIAGLQRTVDALVGKSEGVTIDPLFSDEADMVDMEAVFSQYKLTMLQGLGGLFAPKSGIIRTPALVKSVALG